MSSQPIIHVKSKTVDGWCACPECVKNTFVGRIRGFADASQSAADAMERMKERHSAYLRSPRPR